VSRVPLSDEETKFIFSEAALAGLADLDAGGQREVLNRLRNIVTSESLPSAFVRERIANLDIIAVGDQCRLYTRVVEEIPEGNTEYHVIFLFYIDATHDYPHNKLAEYSRSAERFVDSITNFDYVTGVEEFLEYNDALGEEELLQLLPE